MKKYVIVIALVAVMLMGFANSSNIDFKRNVSDNKIENVDKHNLSKIIVNVPSNVNIYEGDTFNISVRTNDEILRKSIRYNVSDSTLNIWMDGLDNYEMLRMNPDDIKIYIVSSKNVEIYTNEYLCINYDKH